MNTYVALLRGINVGGRNSLPMKTLVSLLEETRAQNVRTYIQSGNLVFQSTKKDRLKIAKEIGEKIESKCGFRPGVQVWHKSDFEAAANTNPFPEAPKDPKSVHVFFLESEPENPDSAKLEEIRAKTEQFEIKGRAFYLYAPDGIGKSKLAAKVESALGVPATARNWRTVSKLVELVGETR